MTLEQTHKTLVQVLEGGGDRVSTSNGEVTLDLRAIIEEAADRIGIGSQVADKIPADAGRIVILRADELDTAQNAFQLLKTLAWFLPLLTLAAFGLAIWLAAERRRAIRGTGWVLVVVGILGLLAANLTRNYVVDSLVAREDDRQAANNAWNILTELMRGSFRLMIVVGILFVVAAWLAGPGRRAVTTRRWVAPGLQNRVWAYIVLVGPRAVPALQRPGRRLRAPPRRAPPRRARRRLDRACAATDARGVPGRGRLDARRRHARADDELVGVVARCTRGAGDSAAPPPAATARRST